MRPILLTGLARFRTARCPVGRADESCIAAAAASAARDQNALTFFGEIREQALLAVTFLVDERADGNRDVEIVRSLSGAIGALTVLTAPCLELGVVAEVDQGVLGGNGDDVDRATSSAITTVRAAARDELLAAKTQTAVATRSGDDVDVDFVDEHRTV